MEGCKCEVAKRSYLALARLLPKEHMLQVGVACRICWTVWYGIPSDDENESE